MRRVLVITSCTAQKAIQHPRALRWRDFRDPVRFRSRQRLLAAFHRPAGEMYTGLQHRWVMQGITRLRGASGPKIVDVKIVSAGYGLLDEKDRIAPYNVTFKEMPRDQVRAWARHLRIAANVRKAIRGYHFVVFLLGADYLETLGPPVRAGRGQRLIFFAPPTAVDRLAGDGVVVLPAGRAEGKTYGAPLTALKGKMFLGLATALSRRPGLFRRIERDRTSRTLLGAMRAKRRPP